MSGQNEKPISRPEASLLARWLQEQGKPPEQGWLSLWRMSPAKVAEEYEVNEHDILVTIRRTEEDEEALNV